jgi:ribonuclease HI
MTAYIYTDGSSRGNPGPGGFGAIIVEGDQVLEIGGREDETTNNRMELKAVIAGLTHVESDDVTVYLDSAYVKQGITEWIITWRKNNWKTQTKEDVRNKDLWQELDTLTSAKKVSFVKIPGHSGIPANERCDEIATGYADGNDVSLYRGTKENYHISLEIDHKSAHHTEKKSSRSPAYSYVSCINGVIQVHTSWDECKARVSGVSHARYKKAVSKEDEERIISDFTS